MVQTIFSACEESLNILLCLLKDFFLLNTILLNLNTKGLSVQIMFMILVPLWQLLHD